jgi:hypothetical protein
MSAFTIAQDRGRVRLVDPDGATYFALGLNHIDGIASSGRYNNIYRDQYKNDDGAACRAAYDHLMRWGFNCCGAGAPRSLQNRLAFFASANVTHNGQWQRGEEFRYDDVFDPAFKDRARHRIKLLADEYRDSPNLIGYYWNDMPLWGIRAARSARGTDWVSFVRGLPPAAAGRGRYLAFLRERHPSIADLCSAYGIAAASHEAALDTGSIAAAADRPRVLEDDEAFLAIIARELYATMGGAFEEFDGERLVLGDRYWLSDTPAGVLGEALRWIDALSIQYGPEQGAHPGRGYERSFDRERLAALHASTGKPIMISDHNISFPTAEHDRTLWHQAPSRTDAADLYREFLLAAVETPFVLGYCKGQYISRHSAWRDALVQGMLGEDGAPYEPYASMVAKANREALVRFFARA